MTVRGCLWDVLKLGWLLSGWVIGSGESGTAFLCRNPSKWPGLMLLGGHCPAANEDCLATGC